MKKTILPAMLLGALAVSAAAPQAEKLDRGLVAVTATRGAFISWRSLDSDPRNMTFDIYRDGQKLNTEPITGGTNYADRRAPEGATYVVKALVDGEVVETTEAVSTQPESYLRVHLDRPEGGKGPDNVAYTYTPNDCSVGDVDGDGQYEIFVKWNPSNSHDNSEGGYTGNVYIDCYTLAGEKLWRVDLGRNIRAGAHYTQFMVYDFDGDGHAEMACKTAPGTIDGAGNAVLMGTDKVTDDYRSSKSGASKGQVISGPEYLTVFDGRTGAAISTVAYEPARSVRTASQWGDSYGGRSERYLAAVAYLDGLRPSLVMCRGYYTAAYLCAWDFDGKELKKRWLHKSETSGQGAYGEGAHSLTVGDVDGDGCDEIVYGSACIDHDGSLLYRTGCGHGDALHLGDFDPTRPGLEVFMVHEEKKKKYDCEFRDAATGKIIWGVANSGNDIGRGIVADINDRYTGHEVWPGSHFESDGTRRDVTFDCKGNVIAEKRASSNFRIYWDGDLLDELFDGSYDDVGHTYAPKITKRATDMTSDLKSWSFASKGGWACNTSKATPNLQADILGDWREELVLWDRDTASDLLIFTTTETSEYRVPSLMQDHNYRMAIAWQNTGYNQPPHLGFNLAEEYNLDPRVTVTEGTLTQSVELGYAIEPVRGTWKNAQTVRATMPEGLKLDVDEEAMTFELSGTPAAAGTSTVVISTVGGTETATARGRLTVSEPVELIPLARYSFEQLGATTPNDVEGAAAVHGAPSLAAGVAGQAVSLGGATDYLTQDAYEAMQLGKRDFTLELWLNSRDDAAYIFHKGSMAASASTGASGKWVGLEYKNGELKFAIDDNVTKSEAKVAATGCFDGNWHHIVAVRESASESLLLYIDGTLMARAADATGDISDNNETIVIGNVNTGFDNPLAGMLDELTVYAGAMSANRVADRYANRGLDGVESIEASPMAPTRLTLVDARTGIVVARGMGDASNVTRTASPGIYLLVEETAGTTIVTKIMVNHGER